MLKHGSQNDESGEIGGGEEEKEKETNVLIFSSINIKGMKRGEQNKEDFGDLISSLSKGDKVGVIIKEIDYEKSIEEIRTEVSKNVSNSNEAEGIMKILDSLKDTGNKKVFLKGKPGFLILKIGHTSEGKNIYINIPIAKDSESTLKLLSKGKYDEINDSELVYGRVGDPAIIKPFRLSSLTLTR
jgi:hypothetical protein